MHHWHEVSLLEIFAILVGAGLIFGGAVSAVAYAAVRIVEALRGEDEDA